MTEIKDIPKGWRLKKLGEVCKLKNGYAFKSDSYENSGVPVIRISDINGGIVSSHKAVRVQSDGEYENYLVENNDILVAMSGATTGKFGIYKSTEKAYQNQRVGKFKILDENILNNEFLYHQINSLKRQIEKDAYGGAQPNISSTKIEQMQIVVPPLPEQKAIVAKIEELLSELENGKEQLQTAQQQLKVYRQSLLKWAFEGKLTNNSNFDIVLLGSVVEKPKYGTSKKCDYKTNGTGVIRIPNIENGDIDATDLKFAEFTKEELETYSLKSGDLLIIRSNGSVDLVGKCALIKEKDCKFLFAGYLIRLRPFQEKVNPKFLQYVLSSHNLRIQVELKAKSTSGVNNINTEEIKSLEIPMPCLKEQQLIVDELESKLTVCDKIEETISQSLQQAETLRQSILKKAFEGKLINYESSITNYEKSKTNVKLRE
jgi:type I restriction enzyme S subunit